jgi:mRNA interferase MazF
MEKDFDQWNIEKKNIDAMDLTNRPFPREGWVWVCSMGINIGVEQNGTGKTFERPVLIVKKFNNQMYWVVPLSSKQKKFDFYHNFTDPNRNAVSLILSQMRLMSIKRLHREMYLLSGEVFENAVGKLVVFLEKSKSRH